MGSWRPAGSPLQHAVEGVVGERVALLNVGSEWRVAFMPAELLEPGRMDLQVLGSVQRAALETMTPESGRIKAGRRTPCLHNAGDSPWIDGLPANRI